MIDPRLLAAYAATEYVIAVEPPVVARSDRQALAVDALLAARGVACAAVVTAWNPYSRLTLAPENARAQASLIAAVEEMGLPWLPVEGRGDDGWPPEASLCVLGISRDAAEALGCRFGQNAILWLEARRPARLLVTA